MIPEAEFRSPTKNERGLLNRLLEAQFPGKDELSALLYRVLVKTVDEDGSLELQSQAEGKAAVVKRIPVEAEATDEDGFVIHLLLHVVEGRPVELEIYKDNLSSPKQMPEPSAFEVIVLPPAPEKGSTGN